MNFNQFTIRPVTYGYAYVYGTGHKFNTNMQAKMIHIKGHVPAANIIKESHHKDPMKRPKLHDLLYNKIMAGDTLVIESVSSLATDTEEALKIYYYLQKNYINLYLINNGKIGYSPTQTMEFSIQAAIAQYNYEANKARTDFMKSIKKNYKKTTSQNSRFPI